MSLNVNRGVTDAFYRYKMPRLQAKVEGKGNGIKTVIVNMADVAKSLDRPPTYPCKYFGCELGAQTQFDFKHERYIVNGSHDANKLQELLDGFIKRFVLCPECENPETILHPNEKKGIIKQNCTACGYQGMLDMRHKLTTFILKNPPDVQPAQQGTSLTKKKDRKSKRSEKDGGGSLRPRSPNAAKGSDASDNEPNGEAETKDDDDDWAVDISEEAVRARMETLSSGVKNLTVTDDVEKSQSERLEIFYSYIKRMRAEGKLKMGACDAAAMKEAASEAEHLEVKESKGVMVLVELLFTENIMKEISVYRLLLLLFTNENPKSQKYLLGAVEKLIELHKKDLLPKVPLILKQLYDNDIVDEEVIFEWGKKVSKKYVSKETATEIHEKAKPFLKWLAEADEETSEDEEEDDIEIEYDDKAKSTSLKEQVAKNDKSAASAPVVAGGEPAGASGDEEGSDIDIDDL